MADLTAAGTTPATQRDSSDSEMNHTGSTLDCHRHLLALRQACQDSLQHRATLGPTCVNIDSGTAKNTPDQRQDTPRHVNIHPSEILTRIFHGVWFRAHWQLMVDLSHGNAQTTHQSSLDPIPLMDLLNYQRTVFAFHGCDRRIRDAVLLGKQKLLAILGYFHPETRETLKRLKERHAKFLRLSKAEQLADLIRRGALTPEGKLPRYPMDHVPLGPRE